jgi:hypothetical protein
MNTGPSWTDNVAVQAPYGLLKGATPVRSTLDLRAKFGAFLKIAVGRYSTATLNAGCDVIVRRVLNNDGTAHLYGASWFQAVTGTSYGYQLVNNASHYAAGAQSIAWDGQAGTAFVHGDLLCLWGQGGTGENAMPPAASGALSFYSGVNAEILRCSAAGTPLLPDSPTKYAHRDNEVFSLADSWIVWLPGGSTYCLIFDPGAVTTASGVFMCMADAQTLDKLTKVT